LLRALVGAKIDDLILVGIAKVGYFE